MASSGSSELASPEVLGLARRLRELCGAERC